MKIVLDDASNLLLHVAGILGALVSLRFAREMNLKKSLYFFGCGYICSVYITPIIMHHFGLEDDLSTEFAFVVGLCGMNILSFIIDLSSKKNIINLIKRK